MATAAAKKRSLFDIEDGDQIDNSNGDEVDQLLLATTTTTSLTSTSPPPVVVPEMTAHQRTRADKNRVKALALKKARVVAARNHGEARRCLLTGEVLTATSGSSAAPTKKAVVDTKAGFFIDEDEGPEGAAAPHLPEAPAAPILGPDRPMCLACSKGEVADSYLMRTFDHPVCDPCMRSSGSSQKVDDDDDEGDGDDAESNEFGYITRTDAKNTFLLKDHDLDVREPPLKFVVRKNPHNPRWGDMKLYLRLQVERRALEVWGSEDALEAAHDRREARKESAKAKKFDKKIKALRMQVRGSLFAKKDYSAATAASHVHDYGDGEEVYDEEKDEYRRTCKICGLVNVYEKM